MRKTLITLACVGSMLFATLALAACGQPSTSTSSDSVDMSSITYVDDETCLSCHGESYEALAETTAALGDWNPHDSIHGGYNSCQNCHTGEHGTIDSQCDNCHDYAPDTE